MYKDFSGKTRDFAPGGGRCFLSRVVAGVVVVVVIQQVVYHRLFCTRPIVFFSRAFHYITGTLFFFFHGTLYTRYTHNNTTAADVFLNARYYKFFEEKKETRRIFTNRAYAFMEIIENADLLRAFEKRFFFYSSFVVVGKAMFFEFRVCSLSFSQCYSPSRRVNIKQKKKKNFTRVVCTKTSPNGSSSCTTL